MQIKSRQIYYFTHAYSMLYATLILVPVDRKKPYSNLQEYHRWCDVANSNNKTMIIILYDHNL